MKVAVTGAHGRVGQLVLAELVKSGHEAVALTRNRWAGCPVEQRLADVLDVEALVAGMQGCDAVIHLAAMASPSAGAETAVFQSNAVGTFNVLLAAGQLGIRRASIASSGCALGDTYNHKALIPDYLPVDERHPPRPDNCYGLGKLALEGVAEGFAQRFDMSIATLRITWVIGPTEYAKPWFLKSVANPDSGPRNLWGYIDGQEAARAFRLGIETNLGGHEVFCISSSVNRCSVPAKLLIEKYYPGAELRGSFGAHESLIDGSKAEALLGFKPEHRLDRVLGY